MIVKVNIKNITSAFTLIELLVVISIIGILATLLLANFNAARGRARDVQRKSDLKNLQTALRIYYNDNETIPPEAGTNQIVSCGVDGTEVCAWGTGTFTSGSEVYIQTMPDDPDEDTARDYQYDRVDNDIYYLSACLENRSDDDCFAGSPPPDGTWCTSDTAFDGCLYVVRP